MRIYSRQSYTLPYTFYSNSMPAPDFSHLRETAYELVRKLGKALYDGPNNYSTIQRLPLGPYLKYGGEPAGFCNGVNVLRLEHQHTSVSAYLPTTRLSGVPLSCAQHELSDIDCERASISKVVNRDAPICNTLGEACRDSRIRNERPIGPLLDEASFSQMLGFAGEPCRRGHRTRGWIRRYNNMAKDIFEEFGDYSKELEIEARSWEMEDGV
ncbi:hypothetical protein GGR51DRAFT_553776 [Nemania sp. FL0031]|nr:hypothetical protein GGR51DRAFT_553776 [Nemania sp. FL0031]